MDANLWLHKSTGQWCRTFAGRRYYFGKDHDQALARYVYEWPFIERGLPIPSRDGAAFITASQLLNLWLDDRLKDVGAGKIQLSTWEDYKKISSFALAHIGRETAVTSLTPASFADLRRAFESSYTNSPTVLSRCVTVVRMAFKWGADEGMYPAMAFGARFKVASKAQKRAARLARGRQVYTPSEVRALIEAANPSMRACLYLGINGGYSQCEIPALRVEDVKGDTLIHLRGKTGVERQVPLWPETVEALQVSVAGRRKGPLVLGHHAQPMTRQAIVLGLRRLREKVPVAVDGGFGKLRATFRTAADGCGDANAIRRIMGHEVGEGVEHHYLRAIEAGRLEKVSAHVRDWLLQA